MRSMSEDPKKKGGTTGPVVFVVIGLLIVLPVLYVLSAGPAALLTDKRYISVETLQTIYRPITWAGKRSPTFNSAINWYIKLWTGAA